MLKNELSFFFNQTQDKLLSPLSFNHVLLYNCSYSIIDIVIYLYIIILEDKNNLL